MCYKLEVQKQNEEKLNKMFQENKVPDFIQDYFVDIASRAGRINYWSTIRDTLNWLIDNKYIECKSISEIKPEDLDKITKAKIIRYFDYLKAHIKLSTLQTKKNQLGSFWQYLQDDHYCRDNIIHAIKSEEYKPVKTNRIKMEKMPLYEDIQEMIEKINKKPDEFIRTRNMVVFRVLRGTGLRQSELANLDILQLANEFTFETQKSIMSETTNELENKIFVITGSVKHYQNRDALKADIEAHGGKVVGSISSKVSYLINNDINSISSKNTKAKSLNIPIITEEDFIKMLK